jgi:transcriptional regulator with XRE-family HTH domain
VTQVHKDNGEVVKIGMQVKTVRERALLTQEELADRAGIGTATLNRIEKDRVEPHFRTIRKLAKALEVDSPNSCPKTSHTFYERPLPAPCHPLHSRLDRRADPLWILLSLTDRSRSISSNSRRLAPSAGQKGSTETTVAAAKGRR